MSDTQATGSRRTIGERFRDDREKIASLESENARLSAELEKEKQRSYEGNVAHAASFNALHEIALITGDGEVDEYSDVVESVARLSTRVSELEASGLRLGQHYGALWMAADWWMRGHGDEELRDTLESLRLHPSTEATKP